MLAAFQIASFDFFADSNHKTVYINKQHFSNPQLVTVRKFIASKVKFITNTKKKASEKDLVAFLSTVYNHSATAVMTNKEAIYQEKTRKDLEQLLSAFSELFPKTKRQI